MNLQKVIIPSECLRCGISSVLMLTRLYREVWIRQCRSNHEYSSVTIDFDVRSPRMRVLRVVISCLNLKVWNWFVDKSEVINSLYFCLSWFIFRRWNKREGTMGRMIDVVFGLVIYPAVFIIFGFVFFIKHYQIMSEKVTSRFRGLPTEWIFRNRIPKMRLFKIYRSFYISAHSQCLHQVYTA